MSGVSSIVIGATVLASIFDGGKRYRRGSDLMFRLNNLDKNVSKADLANCLYLKRVGTFRSNGSIDFEQKSGSGDAAYEFRALDDSMFSDRESEYAESEYAESEYAKSEDPKSRDPEEYRKVLGKLFASQKRFSGSKITDFLVKSDFNATKMLFDGKLVGICQWLSHPSTGVLEKTDTFVPFKDGPTKEPLYKLVRKSEPVTRATISELRGVERPALPVNTDAWKVVGSKIITPVECNGGASVVVSKSAHGASALSASALSASAGGASAHGTSADVSKSAHGASAHGASAHSVSADLGAIIDISEQLASLLYQSNPTARDLQLISVLQSARVALCMKNGIPIF